MKTLTIQETKLLSNILFNDCSYLEDCAEEEFQLYQKLQIMKLKLKFNC